MSLIKEFAVEPRVMATWTHFISLWEDFGVGVGRLVSQYPVLWKQKVDELARELSQPVQATAISAKIRRDGHKFLMTGRNYNGTDTWLANTQAQMATQPFHAIIATANPQNAANILVAGDFAKDDPKFKVKSQDTIPRNAAALVQCAGLLLRHSDEIQLVDPYFDPSERRWRNTFRAMVEHRWGAGSLRVLEVHRTKPNTFLPDVQRSNYAQLARIVPRGLKLRVFFWSQKPDGPALHPRFVLTELGGFNFESGLDEGPTGEVTLVTALQHEVWQECRADYSAASTAFVITADCILEIDGAG